MNPITTVRLQSTSSADQVQVPFTFGQVFKAGDLSPADGLSAGDFPLQVDVKALHVDGSVRHSIISGVYPNLKAGETASLPLVKAKPVGGAVGDLSGTIGTDAKVTLTIDGEAYLASLAGADIASVVTWLAGPVVVEGFVNAPLKNAQGVEHPLLQVRFGVRYYPSTKQARVEVILENCWAYSPNPSNVTYDVEIVVGGKSVYSKKALTHYHHARWRDVFWTGSAPSVNVQHDIAYLIATKAIPNYEQINIPESELAGSYAGWNSVGTGPMDTGPIARDMGSTGGRSDIGIMPGWHVEALLSQDARAKEISLGVADLAGSFSTHYRNKDTGRPIALKEFPYMTVIARSTDTLNPVTNKYEAFPAVVGAGSPYNHDVAHEPAFAYYPYLVTGEFTYLEELHFWANYNIFSSHPGYRQAGKGLVTPEQLRGQGWSLRTLAEAAYITPDNHPSKVDFQYWVDQNLDYYVSKYVGGKDNKLGVITDGDWSRYDDGFGVGLFQQDYFTSNVGHTAELGFEKAATLLKWNAIFPVGRMLGPGFCWIDACKYSVRIKDAKTGKYFETMAEVYSASVDPRIAALKCNSPEQLAMRRSISTSDEVSPGQLNEIYGYPKSAIGYPANFQAALAMAVDSGYKDGQLAWDLFDSRATKPDYSSSSQFNIIPRTVKASAVQQPVPAPAPATLPPSLTIGAKPKDGVAGTWAKIGNENEMVKVDAGTFLRYGAPGKAYVYAQAVATIFRADNLTFGSDPAVQVVKQVEAFSPDPVITVEYSVAPMTVYVIKRTTTKDGVQSVDDMGTFTKKEIADIVVSSMKK